jgi:zinc protease
MRRQFRWLRLPPALLRVSALMVLLASLLAAPSAAVALEVQEIVSSTGVKAWLVEEHSVPLVAMKFAFMGGSAQDPAGKEGLATMVSDLLTEGAGDMSADVFKEKLSQLSTRLTISSGRDAIYGGIATLTKRLGPSAELLRQVLANPRFDTDSVERVRGQHLSDLTRSSNDPTRLALDRWYAEAFPNHPYARPVEGTTDTIAAVTVADLKAMHANLIARDALRIVIVGDLDKRAAIETLDTLFGGLPEKAKITPVEKIEPRGVPAPVVITKDFPLATATFGLPSLRTDHPDFPALQVLNQIIGSGDFDSRLMEEIRVKRGLAYSIQTRLLRDTITSLMVGGVATKNEAMGTTLGVMRDVFTDMVRNGPTPSQFDNAKRYLTGSYLLDFDTNSKVANSLLGIQLDGESPDYLLARNRQISAVTLQDVKRVAGEILKPDRMVVTIVGNPKLAP